MQSPVDVDVKLERTELEAGPVAYRCPKSAGVWVRSVDYQAWLAKPHEAGATVMLPPAPAEMVDSPAGKRCTEDGAFLIRQPVGRGLSFHLDRCGRCGGIWLDAGEWEMLRRAGLDDSLTRVFTDAWQAQIRRERHRQTQEAALRQRLGDEDFLRLKKVDKWLRKHPHRSEILTLLSGDN